MISSLPMEAIWALSIIQTRRFNGNPSAGLAALNLGTGEKRELWIADRGGPPPVIFGNDDLCICFDAMPKITLFLAQGWPLPDKLLDIMTELRNLFNDLQVKVIVGLEEATKHLGIDISFYQREEIQKLRARGGRYTLEEKEALLAYCAKEVIATAELYKRTRAVISLDQALKRGRHLVAASIIERAGLPLEARVCKMLFDQKGLALHEKLTQSLARWVNKGTGLGEKKISISATTADRITTPIPPHAQHLKEVAL